MARRDRFSSDRKTKAVTLRAPLSASPDSDSSQPIVDALIGDAQRYFPQAGKRHLMALFVMHPGFRATSLYRLGRVNRLLGSLSMRIMHHLCHCSISPHAILGSGLHLPHPMGIVIGSDVVIGYGCTIQQNVTLGGNYGRSAEGRDKPILGNEVAVSVGAVVAGPVIIGDGARIGANVVVTRDIPAGFRGRF